jgi:hypothetical protein
MRLKDNVSPSVFLQRVDQCAGEVLYKTSEGDILNLKSQLSKYLFLIAVNAPAAASLRCGEITCNVEDHQILKPFFHE